MTPTQHPWRLRSREGHGSRIAGSGFVHSYCMMLLASFDALRLGNADFAQFMDFGFCPLALAPLNRAPRALAHPSPRRSAILECLSAPRALAGARKVPRMARRGHARIISVETHRLPFLGYLWRWVLVLILTLISQLCRPRRCNAPGQATRNPLRAAVSTTPIHSSSTTAPEARAAVRTR